jgi:hypothetical protein
MDQNQRELEEAKFEWVRVFIQIKDFFGFFLYRH